MIKIVLRMIMMKTININLDKSISRLAGFDYGKEIYRNQVHLELHSTEKTEIRFPDNIHKVATSFVQGFFSDLVNSIGYDYIRNNIIIKAKDDALINEIWDRLY